VIENLMERRGWAVLQSDAEVVEQDGSDGTYLQ